jgi:hypothetical protein
MKRLIIVLPLAVMLCSCAPANRKHLGEWKSIVPGIGELSLKIDQKTIEMTTPEGVQSGEYTIDYAKTPIQLDVSWGGDIVRCIIEFIDRDTFKIIGEDEANKPRPSSFAPEEEVVLFQRVKKKAQPSRSTGLKPAKTAPPTTPQ